MRKILNVFLEVVQDENVPHKPATMAERVDYANSSDPEQSRQNIWQDPQMYLEKVREIRKRHAQLLSMQYLSKIKFES